MMTGNLPPVLMYHAVDRISDDPNLVCVSPERFEAQMAYIKGRGLRGVSMRELVEAMEAGKARGLVGLTFDDGYESFLHYALPTLEGYGFAATIFVLGGMLGGFNNWDTGPRLRLLGAQGIREVDRRGIEVGSHGWSHTRLAALDSCTVEEEVARSRHDLSMTLERDVEGFCYPYGNLDAPAADAVRRAGYAYACAYKTRVSHDLYDLPRIHVGEKDGAFRLGLKLRGLARYKDMIRTSG
jgi:peptidoglycan/xylan/chitin deacetylase (PgdA/CDA1 family)